MINDNDQVLATQIKAWGRDLGFSDIRITNTDLIDYEPGLQAWLDAGFHGKMSYMAQHGLKRARPAEMVPGAASVIMARMDYLPENTPQDWRETEIDAPAERAVISMYARGRDYHKILRKRLQWLAEKIERLIGPFGYRVFTDSAPVMEIALAEKSGLGWRGKHTLLLNQQAGSMFFIGEIITDLRLPVDTPETPHCGTCQACITCCPTQAIIAPYQLDARRCISYLTIELRESIPVEFRSLIGNRVYGCDDCQLYCPWNKFAQRSDQADFNVRYGLDRATLIELFMWSESDFLTRFEGSPIRRIGYQCWLRNLAVGLGNARRTVRMSNLALSASMATDHHDSLNTLNEIETVLKHKLTDASELVKEHILWALEQ